MQITDVPYPGLLPNGLALRREVAKALSAAQIVSMNTPGGRSALAGSLRQFFLDSAVLLEDLYDSDLPVADNARVGPTDPNMIVIGFSEDMDPGVPPISAFVIGGSANMPVSAAWLSSVQLAITMESAYTDASTIVINYTPPDAGALKDAAGNVLLAFGD